MIWSIIKLIIGCFVLISVTVVNCFTWLLYFGWNKEMYTMYWTDREANVQYYYNGNILAWAFRVKRLADSAFDITKKQHIIDEK